MNRRIFEEAEASQKRLLVYPVSTIKLMFLSALLVLPAIALVNLGTILNRWSILGGFVVVSFVTYLVCRSDKQKAQAGQWRTSEATLHLLELLGGWPASYFAQRRFRHKISKGSYQFVFWLIVLVYQLVAFEYLNSWKYSRQIFAQHFGQW